MGVILGFNSAFGYSLAYFLLPPKNRGLVGGVITAIVYGVAAMSLPTSWTLSAFLHDSLAPAPGGVSFVFDALGLFSVKPVSQEKWMKYRERCLIENYGTKKKFSSCLTLGASLLDQVSGLMAAWVDWEPGKISGNFDFGHGSFSRCWCISGVVACPFGVFGLDVRSERNPVL